MVIDGSRGRIPCGDRAAHERSHYVSPPYGEHPLRTALHDWSGVGFMILFAALVLMA